MCGVRVRGFPKCIGLTAPTPEGMKKGFDVGGGNRYTVKTQLWVMGKGGQLDHASVLQPPKGEKTARPSSNRRQHGIHHEEFEDVLGNVRQFTASLVGEASVSWHKHRNTLTCSTLGRHPGPASELSFQTCTGEVRPHLSDL